MPGALKCIFYYNLFLSFTDDTYIVSVTGGKGGGGGGGERAELWCVPSRDLPTISW